LSDEETETSIPSDSFKSKKTKRKDVEDGLSDAKRKEEEQVINLSKNEFLGSFFNTAIALIHTTLHIMTIPFVYMIFNLIYLGLYLIEKKIVFFARYIRYSN